MSSRPLPPIPYRGPIISTARPIPATQTLASTRATCKESSPNLSPVLQRRAHTRRLQSARSNDLSSVFEEDEGDLAEDDEPSAVYKSRRRPRPTPLVPSRSYTSSKLPLILEIPDTPVTLQEQSTKSNESENFLLSPSALFTRRRSETVLNFPVPPTRTPPPPPRLLSTPTTPPRQSPTPSHTSFSSASTDSLPYPPTPTPSGNHDDELRSHSAKDHHDFVDIEDFIQELDSCPPRPYHRSASVIGLRSFSIAQSDVQVEPIYTLMYPKPAPPVPVVQTPKVNHFARNAQIPRGKHLKISTQNHDRSAHMRLSVLDTAHGGSFDVPLVLGSFLSPPSSPSSTSSTDSESDDEDIPVSWSDSENDDAPLDAALSSSEDEISGDEEGPSCVLDPTYRAGSNRCLASKHSNDGRRGPLLSPPQRLESLQQFNRNSQETTSVYSQASPVGWRNVRPLPRRSLVPSDISSPTAPSLYHHRSPSPSIPSAPEPRSRFSTSTFASIPEPPTSLSSKYAFFARLTGRTKPPKQDRIPFAPTNERPSNPSRGSVRRCAHTPASSVPSASSFSTQSTSSRSSLDSTADSGRGSCSSDKSSRSTGLRRPPIPIEFFLRG